jgi:hypothetical protein
MSKVWDDIQEWANSPHVGLGHSCSSDLADNIRNEIGNELLEKLNPIVEKLKVLTNRNTSGSSYNAAFKSGETYLARQILSDLGVKSE